MSAEAGDDQVSSVLEQMAGRGMRRTAPRQAILEALLSSGGHVSADELAATVQRRFPSVNLSTVYRTLEALEELEVIDHIHLGHGRAIYHLVDDDHQHLVCQECDRVEEVPAEKVRSFLSELEAEFGFEVDWRHFALVGVCEACRQAEEARDR
jgi:Fur family ferric uptake transcriptional regulator